MALIRKGRSTTRPLVLDGTNYSYQKARMIAFLKSIDQKTCKAIVTKWSHSEVTNKDEIVSPKPEIEQTVAEEEASTGNSQALNVIFNRVDQNVCKLIKTLHLQRRPRVSWKWLMKVLLN